MDKYLVTRAKVIGLFAGLLTLNNATAEVIRLDCTGIEARYYSVTIEIDTEKNTVNNSPANLKISAETFTFGQGRRLHTISRGTYQMTEVYRSDDVEDENGRASTSTPFWVTMHYQCKKAEPKQSGWWPIR
jgi:hypothetical protein